MNIIRVSHMQRTFAFLVTVIVLAPVPVELRSQELDATVKVNYEAVATSNKDLLRSFPDDVKEYLNNYKWGPDDLDEKIKCTVDIFVQSVVGENRYSAQVFVGSQRPIYGLEKSSAVVRLFDDTWEFTYVRNRPINHNSYSFDDLSSFLDFYAFVAIGYDYDTYESLSGTPFFQKAADIASLGRSSGIKGWQPSTSNYSRPKLVDELLNNKFAPLRQASYKYHFTGLDSLAFAPQHAYSNILHALEAIALLRRQVDPRNVVIKAFFDSKYLEIADLFMSYPDPGVYVQLATFDPAHQSTYEQYRDRRSQ